MNATAANLTIAYILDGFTIYQDGNTYILEGAAYSSLARAMSDAARMAKFGK